MRKESLVFSVFAVVLIILSSNINAQEYVSKIKVGGGLAYGSEINTAAVFAKGAYQVNEKWEGALTINYYFPKEEGPYEITWLGFDLDAHYYFHQVDKMNFYGIAGLNIMRISLPSYNFDGYKTPSVSNTETGINLGAGGTYFLTKSISGLAEVKYAIAGAGFFQISVGVLYHFGQ